jgi:ATP-dependent Clp protease ATP-binding subunit ClpC
LKTKLSSFRKEKEKAVKNQAFETAAQLRDELKFKKERRLRKMKEEWAAQRDKERVTLQEDDIAQVVSKNDRYPLFRLEEKESKRLMAHGGRAQKENYRPG